MKILDQNDQPITDVSTLPAIESATATATATGLSTTNGKNGVHELPDWTGPSCDEWCSWLLQAGNGNEIEVATTAANEETRVMKLWPSAFAKASGIITSFLRRKPSLLHELPAIQDAITEVHHINGDPTDNHIENLELVESSSTDQVSDADDKRLSPRDQMVARLRHIRGRLIAYANQLTTRPAAVAAFVTTAQSLDMAIAGAATLPADWKPVRTPPTAALAEGIHVFIKSKNRALYQSDLSAEEMDDLVVERIGGKRLRCHCVASGTSIFIPAGHVEVL